MNGRRFLMLQGVCSPFFMRLADRLQVEGHRVFKVNFNVGDRAYWGLRPAAAFRSRLAALPEFIDALFARHGITDQILFGDCRPVHEPAVRLARERGIRNHVFEEGYFRPHWVTLEREGTNANSRLPRDAGWFRRTGARLPDRARGAPFSASFWKRAAHDVAYPRPASEPALLPARRGAMRRCAPTAVPRHHCAARCACREVDHARVASLVERRTPFFLAAAARQRCRSACTQLATAGADRPRAGFVRARGGMGAAGVRTIRWTAARLRAREIASNGRALAHSGPRRFIRAAASTLLHHARPSPSTAVGVAALARSARRWRSATRSTSSPALPTAGRSMRSGTRPSAPTRSSSAAFATP
jgi:hypothetical protein